MRKRYRVLILAALVAATTVPLGFALSPQTGERRSRPRGTTPSPSIALAMSPTHAPVLIGTDARPQPPVHPLQEAAKLMFAGLLLIGAAQLAARTA